MHDASQYFRPSQVSYGTSYFYLSIVYIFVLHQNVVVVVVEFLASCAQNIFNLYFLICGLMSAAECGLLFRILIYVIRRTKKVKVKVLPAPNGA